ncbi:MAG: SAM-dependent methyltransferase [Ignavibacteria bacterium]|nr:SAM-dependent methyltransferase [Ignavibacteria bacterium]
MQKGKLYLIPVSLGNYDLNRTIPPYVREVINNISHYIVENVNSAVSFLKSAGIKSKPGELSFSILNVNTSAKSIREYLIPAEKGLNLGLLSEAGVPCVADPGSELVSAAHEMGIDVVPLTGPSSVILALMASGLNGQNFMFEGYLPVERLRRRRRLNEISRLISSTGITVIFIEAPQRNDKLLEDIMEVVNENHRLCIAKEITLETEFIKSKKISKWKKEKIKLGKHPAIFLIGR